jgi:hypothetical protein
LKGIYGEAGIIIITRAKNAQSVNHDKNTRVWRSDLASRKRRGVYHSKKAYEILGFSKSLRDF